ncbi:MAG: methyl-accepting chemotaxis protein [Pseudomonadota bacterium]
MSKSENTLIESDTQDVSVEPSASAHRYHEDVDVLTGRFRALSKNGKLAFTVGIPLLVLMGTAGFAIVGLGQIANTLEASAPEARELAAQQAQDWRNLVIAAVVVGFGLIAFLAHALRSDILNVTEQMVDCMRRISSGTHDIVVPHRTRPDEFGMMCDEIENMRQNAIALSALSKQVEARAAAEIEEQTRLQIERETAQSEREQALRNMADRLESTVGEVVNSVASASSELQATSTMMAASAEQASNRTKDVSTSMDEANSGATAAAAASDEFAMSIGEISRQAASSAELARKATASATEADETISALSDSAEQVGQIVELIQTIAQRTNLLALNASIEAARGGEAGRGFAVVASEVKELAMQTSRATEQVAEQIRAMQDTTGASVSALRSIATEVAQLENTAVSIASAVDQQSVAGQDLARSIDLAARGTEQVSGHIKEVSELSVSTGSAASQVLESSTALEEQASVLRVQVDDFLATVRAG